MAVFCGTDGIDDSYSSIEELYALYRSILSIIAEHGIDIGKREIEDYLPILTKRGSGDDVSVASIIDVESVARLAPLFKVQSQLFKLRTERDIKTGKLDTISEKIRVLSEKKEKHIEKEKSVEDIDADIKDLLAESMRYKEAIEADESEIFKLNSQYQEVLDNIAANLLVSELQTVESEENTDEVINVDNDDNSAETMTEVLGLPENT